MFDSIKDKQSSSFEEMTLLYRRFMQLIGLLPFEGRDYTYSATRVLAFFFVSTSFMLWSSLQSYMISGGVPTIDFICEMVMVSGYIARYYLLLWNRRDLANLLEHCRTIWHDLCNDENERRTVRYFERKVRLLFYWMFGSFCISCVLFCGVSLNQTLEALRNNDTHTKYLPLNWFAEGAEDMWPGYKINFALEFIAGWNSGVISATIDTAAPLLIMIGAGYFRVLQLRLYRAYENALENVGETLFDDREIINCLRLHQRILNYCSEIDKVSRTLIFILLLTTAYNISLVGLQLAGTDPGRFKYAPVAFQSLCQLFICQWAPDHLLNESEAISTAAYSVSVPWMKRPIGKSLMLMIRRAQKPVHLTAAGVIYLSLENFGALLKGALSFFMVLRRLNV